MLLSFLLRPPKSQRSAAPSADYGVSIPRVLGTHRLVGNIVLQTRPIERKASGKGGIIGSPGSKQTKYFGTAQVLVGEGNLHRIHGETGFTQSRFLSLQVSGGTVISAVNVSSGLSATFTGSATGGVVDVSIQLTSTTTQTVGEYLVGVLPSQWRNVQNLDRISATLLAVEHRRLTSNDPPQYALHLIAKQGSILYRTGGSLEPRNSVQTDIVQGLYTYNRSVMGVSGLFTSAFFVPCIDLSTNTFITTGPALDFSSNFDLGIARRDANFPISASDTQFYGTKFSLISSNPANSTIELIKDLTSNGELFLKKIYINDKIWYNKDDSKTRDKLKYVEWYTGSQTQGKSPKLSSILGAANTPEYRGISYVVFKDLPLHEFGGDNYPTFHFEVETNIPISPKVLICDLMYRCGVYFNRQLTQNNHYTITPGLESVVATENMQGFQIDQQNTGMKDYLDQLSQMYDLSYYQTDSSLGTPFIFEKNYDFSGGVSSDTGVVIDLERADLNTSQDRQAVPVYEVSSDSRKITSSVEVKAQNVNNNYENVAITLNQFVGESGGEVVSLTFALATNSADFLRLLAQRALVKSRHGSVEITHTDGSFERKPQDVVRVKDTALPLLRTKRISIGGNGLVKTERYSIAEGSINTSSILPQPNNNNFDPSEDTAYFALWFEGQKQINSLNQNLANRLAHVIVASTSRTGLNFTTSLSYTIDQGVTVTPTGQSVAPNALYCSIVIDAGFAVPSNINVIDADSVITITVPSGTELPSITDADMFNRAQNLIAVPGLGIFSYGIATVSGTNEYKLSRILWNLGQTLWDGNKVLADYSGPCYLMMDDLVSFPIPNSVPLGANLYFSATNEDGSQSTDLGVFSPATLRRNPEIFDGLCDYPRHVTNVLFNRQTNGDLLVQWVPPLTQTQFQASEIFAVTPTDAVTYDLVLRSGTTTLTTITGVSGTTSAFTAAQLGSNADINVTIRPLSLLGAAMPESNLIRNFV
jgi:hypothetical protein